MSHSNFNPGKIKKKLKETINNTAEILNETLYSPKKINHSQAQTEKIHNDPTENTEYSLSANSTSSSSSSDTSTSTITSDTAIPSTTTTTTTASNAKTVSSSIVQTNSASKLLPKTPNNQTTTATTSTTSTTSTTGTANNTNKTDTTHKKDTAIIKKSKSKSPKVSEISERDQQIKKFINRLVRVSQEISIENISDESKKDEINKKIAALLEEEITVAKQRYTSWSDGIIAIRKNLEERKNLFSEKSQKAITLYLTTQIERLPPQNDSPLLTLINSLSSNTQNNDEAKSKISAENSNSDDVNAATDFLKNQYNALVRKTILEIEESEFEAEENNNNAQHSLTKFISSFDDYLLETLGSPAKSILDFYTNRDHRDTGRINTYCNIIRALRPSILVFPANKNEKEESKIHFSFLPETATKDFQNQDIFRNVNNTSLAHKLIFSKPINDHVRTKEEVRQIIQAFKLEDQIYFSSNGEETDLTLLHIKERLINNPEIGSLQILLNESSNHIHPTQHWGVGKISYNEITQKFTVEYADSTFADCPLYLIKAFKKNFGNKVSIKIRDEVFQNEDTENQSIKYSHADLALQWAIRNTGLDHPVSFWEGKSIKALRHIFDKCLMESHRFMTGDLRLTHISEKNKDNMLEEDFGDLQFKPEFIANTLNPPNPELPFNKLVNESVDELDAYIKEYEESYWYKWNLYKEEYDKFIKDAKAISTCLAGCKNNEELKRLYNYGLVKNEKKPEIKKLLKDLENSGKIFSSLPALSKILEGIGSRITTRLDIKFNPAKNPNPEESFRTYVDKLKNIATKREVTPNEFSWMGQQWLIANDIAIDTERHTVFDEIIGKLLKIKNDRNKSPATKCADMEIVIHEATVEINKSRFAKPFFGRPLFTMFNGSRAANALNHIQDEAPNQVIVKAVEEPKYYEEYYAVWNQTVTGETVDEQNANRLLNLLNHYTVPPTWGGWFKSWNSHHIDTTKNILEEFRKNPPKDPKLILDRFTKTLNWETTNPNGDLVKVLRYGAHQTANKFLLRMPDDEFAQVQNVRSIRSKRS